MPEAPPPIPIAASFVDPVLTVQFDRQLQPGLLDEGNWVFRWANDLYFVLDATAVADTVVCNSVPDVLDPGPDVVSYSPPPFDVISLLGTPAAAFSDFPIT